MLRRPLSVLALCGLLLCSIDAQSLPSGFIDVPIVTGLSTPIALAFLPDGRLLIAEQISHTIKVFAGATTAVVGVVPNVSSDSFIGGLMSIAVDPQWPGRPYIYAFYSSETPHRLRVSLFPVSGDLVTPTSATLALGSEYPILTDIPDDDPDHDGGAVHFGPDGFLYLSLGDDGDPCGAQAHDSFKGAILRLDVSGLPTASGGPPPIGQIAAPGNPFQSGNSNASLTYAYGLRNPFRFHIDPLTGALFIADVGESAWEEIDFITAGGKNLGWPFFESMTAFGSCGPPPATVEAPIAVLPHVGGPTAIISMGTYRNPAGAAFAFGPAYEGDYFYTDFYTGAIRRIRHTGAGWVTAPPVPGQPTTELWASGITGIADAAVGPDGAFYYAKHTAGSIRRIQPVLQNDVCANATPLVPGVISGETTTAAGPSLTTACGTISRPRWYRFTNTSACVRNVTVDTCSDQTDFDTIIAVFADGCTPLTPIACGDDDCQLKSQASFTAAPGQSYLVAVGGKGATGNFVLSLDPHSLAAAIPLGSGCGATPAPSLTGTPPFLGQVASVSLQGAAPDSTALLLFSGAPGYTPLPNGCALFLENGSLGVLFTFATDVNGSWGLSVLVPPEPSLSGAQLLLQALILPATQTPFVQTTNLLYIAFDC